MIATESIPQWVGDQLRTVYVSPLMPTLFGHLPVPIRLQLELPQGQPLPPSAAGLLKLAQLVPTLHVVALQELPPDEPAQLVARTAYAELRMTGEPLHRSLESLADRLLVRLLSPEQLGELLRGLAYEGTTASTLQAITTQMLSTYDIDRALHVMLSGLTAGFSLGFNRAAFFLHDPEAQVLRGRAAIGPASAQEAHLVWEALEAGGTGIEELIIASQSRQMDSTFQALVKGIELPLNELKESEDEVVRALAESHPVHFRRPALRNPMLARLGTSGEFVLAAVRAHHRLLGLIFADDYYLGSSIDPMRLRHLRFFIDQTALVLENLELLDRQLELARRDPLTGALNRRELETLLPLSVEAALRDDRSLALLVVDLDGFKGINDRRGHAEGDRILRGVNSIAQAVMRADDLVARYGGDEFVLLLQGLTRSDAAAVAERVRERVHARLGITVSIGLAMLPADAITAAELFTVADDRMYQAKRAGRDRLVGG